MKSRFASRVALPLSLLVLLFISRHVLAPVRDFVLDDWPNLLTAQSMSYPELIQWAIRDVFRPVYNSVFFITYKWLGNSPLAFSTLAFAVQAALVLTVWRFAARISDSSRIGYVAAAVFCLIPVTNEAFYVHLTSVVLYVPVLYMWSLMMFHTVVHSGANAQWLRLLLSAILYAAAVFSYEYGVFLCPLYILLALQKHSLRKALVFSIPYWSLAFMYIGWRFTRGFGYGLYTIVDGSYFDNEPLGFGVLLQNGRNIASWWVGGRFWTTFSEGLIGFLSIKPKYQFVVILADIGVLLSALIFASRLSSPSSRTCPARLYALCIFVLASLPFILFMACSRHNTFPSIGVSILVASFIARSERLARPAILLPLVLFTVVCQGLAPYWRDNGQLHRDIYNSLANVPREIERAEVLLVDTGSMRHRLTPGLGAPASRVERFGPATLPRSWVVSSMFAMQHPNLSRPLTVMDWESGARWTNSVLCWHERFNPSKPHTTSRESVVVYDLYSRSFVPAASGGL